MTTGEQAKRIKTGSRMRTMTRAQHEKDRVEMLSRRNAARDIGCGPALCRLRVEEE